MQRRQFLFSSVAAIAVMAAVPALADAMSDAQAVVDKYASKVTTWDGPTTGPKGAKGKSIAIIAADLKNGGILGAANGMQEAATALGWTVKVLDGAGSINGRTAAFGQAMALKPDGIAIIGFDAVEQGPAMQQAKDAKIAMVSWHAASAVGPVPEVGVAANVTTDPQQVSKAAADWAFIDAKGRLLTDTPEAIDAAKMYQTLLAKYGPQGVAGFNWNEAQSLFLQGKAAMWLDGIGFAQPLEDPTKSRIVGKVGYGVMPAGPKAQVSAMFGDGEGISASSKKQGPAWFYLQWASNKTNQFRMLQAASGAPVRNSAYIAAQSSADIKAPKQWIECMLTSARIAQPGLPLIVPVTEFRDVFGIALTNMINGADPAAELKKATAEFQPILDKSEKT